MHACLNSAIIMRPVLSRTSLSSLEVPIFLFSDRTAQAKPTDSCFSVSHLPPCARTHASPDLCTEKRHLLHSTSTCRKQAPLDAQ